MVNTRFGTLFTAYLWSDKAARANSVFLQRFKPNPAPCSSHAAPGNGHQADEASKSGGEGRVCDPQQTEGARAPLRHDRRAVLAGTP